MERLRALMSRKVAGVPVGIIAVVIAGALLYVAIRVVKPAPDSIEDDPTADPDAATDVDPNTIGTGDTTGSDEQPVFIVPNGTVPNSTGTVPGAAGMATPVTNDLWEQAVSTWLIGQGVPGSMAPTIVDNYMNGVSMNVTDTGWINKAIAVFGLPPEGAPNYTSLPSTTVPTPTTPTTPTTPSAPSKAASQIAYGKTHRGKQSLSFPVKHIVQGTFGDTSFGGLGRIYGGSGTVYARQIKATPYNLGYREPLKKGEIVQIDRYRSPVYMKARKGLLLHTNIAAKYKISVAQLQILNPGLKSPVRIGTNVRVR